MDQHACIILTPKIYVRAERVSEVLSISINKADELLTQPDTKDLIQAALERAFVETVDKVLAEMSRIPSQPVNCARVDAVVNLPSLPALNATIGSLR